VAGLALAFFPNQIYFSTLLMSETLFVFLVVGLLLLTVLWTRRGTAVSWYQAALLGAFIGLATYVRGEALLLPLLLTAVWLVVARPRWRALALGGLALAVTGLMIMPWVVRNAREVGHPVVMSTGSGRNLFAGHWEGADGGGSTPEAMARMVEGYEHLDRPEQDVAVYKASFKQAFDFAIHHPLKELTLVGQKLYNLYREDADGIRLVQSTRPEAVELHEERFTVIANGYYFVAVGLALLSAPVWFSLRDPRRLMLIGAILYFSFVFGVIFIGEPRHHFPVIPVVSLLAAAACVRIWEAGRRGRPVAAASTCQAS
jgi:4-amino-4-deoxy-L-arabinose transferase-like glycosyltransferase